MTGIKTVFGAASVTTERLAQSEDSVKKVVEILQSGDVAALDTAQLYGDSESVIGQYKLGDLFPIDTKWVGGFGESKASRENILKSADESIKKLGVKHVDIFYIHSPDHSTDIEETLAAVNEVYKKGYFKRFGLSNYYPEDVKRVYECAKKNGYVLPTVFQGNYNAVARKYDTVLLPLLREYGISFYAYSPLAGGFLTKTKEQIEGGKGRFNISGDMLSSIYTPLYVKPAMLEALAKWEALAKKAGISRAALAYRWVKYDSPLSEEYGDALIIGATTTEQLKDTLDTINAGPLDAEIVKGIDEIWKSVEHEAPMDNLDAFKNK